MRRGIAIYKPLHAIAQDNVDENGYYIAPKIRTSFIRHSLQAFFTEAEDFADTIDEVLEGREALLDSYYFIKGYNLAIDLIASSFDIPEIEVFKMNIRGIEEKIDAFNELVPSLYAQIYDTDYEDAELKQRKLQVLKDFFTPVDYKSLTIPEENIEAAKALFTDFKGFRGDTDIGDLLCHRLREDEGGEE